MSDMNIPPAGVLPPPGITDYLQAPQIAMRPTSNEGESFSKVLKQAMIPGDAEVHFSKHAEQRMASRSINLDSEDMRKLDEGMNKARAKGAREALILIDGNAFVANVNNRTVITALGQQETKGALFTQIDSTVIMDK